MAIEKVLSCINNCLKNRKQRFGINNNFSEGGICTRPVFFLMFTNYLEKGENEIMLLANDINSW